MFPDCQFLPPERNRKKQRLAEDCLFINVGAVGREIRLNERSVCLRCGDGAGEALKGSVDGKATFTGGLAAAWWHKSKHAPNCSYEKDVHMARIPARPP